MPHSVHRSDDRFENKQHAGARLFSLKNALEGESSKPLQQLVGYFNDRFEKEQHSNIRPFVVEKGLVSGLFGPIRIGSVFLPIRHFADIDALAGHAVQLSALPYSEGLQNIPSGERVAGPVDTIQQPVNFQSIINLDRLCRTVHMLNYLPYSHRRSVLFLDVDPRHILGVKRNHGAYFEENIVKCGLATNNIVISIAINHYYALHHQQLLEGLSNYRQRGYQLAVNVGQLYFAKGLADFIAKLSPEYLRVNIPDTGHPDMENVWHSGLNILRDLQDLVGGQTILQQVNRKEQAALATELAFDLVQGHFYDKVSLDYPMHRMIVAKK